VCGLMDKAPDFGSGDCRFESCHARIFFCIVSSLIPVFFKINIQIYINSGFNLLDSLNKFYHILLKYVLLFRGCANAVPHFQKLCYRVTHVWGNRRGQPILSAMDKPHPRGTTFMIMVNLLAR
jgi:hypothetical protein